ncbi:MAG: tetratricopeptide repeat protein [Acidobacteriota bacterium]|nr:tetratricopeptide repeat protein [Acidobacteriota bacterium]
MRHPSAPISAPNLATLITSAAILLLAAIPAQATPIKATVKDVSGRPLPEIQVTATGLGESGWSAEATTDRKGRFEIDVPEDGTGVQLELVKEGYRELVRHVRAQDLAEAGRRGLKLKLTMLGEEELGRFDAEAAGRPKGEQGFSGATAAWEVYERGLRAHEAGRPEDARILFEQALDMEPLLPPANAAMALYHLDDGEPAQAVTSAELFLAHADAGSSSSAMTTEVKKIRRDALFALGDCDRALPAALELLEREPRDFSGLQVKYGCLVAQGETVEAAEALEELSQADSLLGSAILLHNLAVGQFKAGEREKAARTFEAALELDPEMASAWGGLAKSHVLDKRYEEAAQAATQYLRRRPMDAEGLAIRYDSLEALGRHDEAAPVLDELAEIDATPLTARRLHQAGYRLAERGHTAESRPYFERAAAMDPELTIARRALAIACYRLEDYQCSLEVSADLLAENPEDEQARLQMEKARRALRSP